MNQSIFIGLGLVVLIVVWRMLSSSWHQELDKAQKNEDLAGLLAAIGKLRHAAQADAYNHAIRRFWDAYQRPLAVVLLRSMAEQHPDASMSQYWLDQVRKVEPKLAVDVLGQGFYDSYFQPQVAATCGKAG